MSKLLLIIAETAQEFAELAGEMGVPLTFLENVPAAKAPGLFPFCNSKTSIIRSERVHSWGKASWLLNILRNGDIGVGITSGYPDLVVVGLVSDHSCSLFVPLTTYQEHIQQAERALQERERKEFLEKFLPEATKISVNGGRLDSVTLTPTGVQTSSGHYPLSDLLDPANAVQLFKLTELKSKQTLMDEAAKDISARIVMSLGVSPELLMMQQSHMAQQAAFSQEILKQKWEETKTNNTVCFSLPADCQDPVEMLEAIVSQVKSARASSN